MGVAWSGGSLSLQLVVHIVIEVTVGLVAADGMNVALG